MTIKLSTNWKPFSQWTEKHKVFVTLVTSASDVEESVDFGCAIKKRQR